MAVAAGIGIGLSVLGLGQQHAANKETKEANRKQAAWDIEMAQEDIKIVQFQGDLEQANIRRTFAAHAASMQARSSSSGARVGVGSNALSLVHNARNMATEEAISIMEEESAVRRLETGATMSEIQSQLTASAQRRQATGDYIQAGVQIASMVV